MPERRGATRLQWLSKTLAGALGGVGLAVAASSLLAWLGPGGMAPLNKYQVTMWLIPPLWLLVMSAVYLFTSAWRAWLWLGAANALAFGGLALVRQALG